MEITITCKSYEELTQLAETLLGRTGAARAAAPAQGGVPAAPTVLNVPVTSNTPTVPTVPGVPTATKTLAAPAVPQLPPAAPVQNAGVPTTAASYTQEDLAKAAITLMDSGRQAELQQLLTGFGVASLPELPTARYGEFATALRTMGAPI